MIFKFKKSTVTVDCFIYDRAIYEYYKPDTASKFLPKEFKALDKTFEFKPYENSKIVHNIGTIRECAGFLNNATSSFIIPAWADFSIESTQDGIAWHARNNTVDIAEHPKDQMWKGFYTGWSHAKLMSPWVFNEKTGIHFAWSECDWHNTESKGDVRILSGNIDYKVNSNTHINMMIKHGYVYKCSAGDPLVQLTPMTDKKVIFKHHLVSPDEWQMKRIEVSTFNNDYHKKKKIVKENSKCPFGFGK